MIRPWAASNRESSRKNGRMPPFIIDFILIILVILIVLIILIVSINAGYSNYLFTVMVAPSKLYVTVVPFTVAPLAIVVPLSCSVGVNTPRPDQLTAVQVNPVL